MLKLLLSLTLVLTICSGCSFGVKEKQTIVYAGFAKEPLELRGAIRIATNRKIPVTVIGETKIQTHMDLGGMVVVKAADLKALYIAYKEQNK